MCIRDRKDLKRVKKRGFDISLLTDIIKKLAAGETLPEKIREHQLSGDYTGCRECHSTPDWLLIYDCLLYTSVREYCNSFKHFWLYGYIGTGSFST